MLKYLFFKLVDLYTYYKPTYENFKVSKKYMYEDGQSQIHYTYNDKPYVYIGDETQFPPKFVPTFSVPIKKAIYKGDDITQWVKMCAGPKVIIPDVKYILAYMRWKFTLEIDRRINFRWDRFLVPDEDAVIEVEDVFNQKRVLGKTSHHQD